MRFSLLALIALTTFAGVACAALVKPSVDWLSVVVSVWSLTLAAQVLRFLLHTDQRRAAAGGWLLFALVYLAIVFGPWTSRRLGPALATSQAIDYAQARWLPEEQRININNTVSDLYLSNIQTGSFPYPLTAPSASNLMRAFNSPGLSPSTGSLFHLTAHWLCAWLAGLLGAAIAAAFYRRRARQAASQPRPAAICNS